MRNDIKALRTDRRWSQAELGTPCGRQSSHVLTGYFCWLLVS